MENLMSPVLLRQLWATIDEAPSSTLLGLNGQDLANTLITRVQNKQSLTGEEREAVRDYIESRSLLIRDLLRTQSAWFVQSIPLPA